ncbi:MAG: transcription antitermination factor NusB [Alphaproteobacteria bacterium]|nr:transcription antitermination factor NusB [Alphaproteobacteria bacterium]
MSGTPSATERASRHRARSLARLAAVQALYQMDVAEADAGQVIAQFRARGFEGLAEMTEDGEALPADPVALGDPDLDWFEGLVRGVIARQLDIDRAVNRHLARGWPLHRIDIMLRALFRSAAFELLDRPDVPARVVIDDYLDIADAFYDAPERGFVNGVLDALARDLRKDEFSAR